MNKTNIDKQLDILAGLKHHQKVTFIESLPDEIQAAMLERMENDTTFFVSVCMKETHPYVPDHHKAAFKILDDESIRNVGQVWARKMGKTTTKRAKVIQSACFKLRKFICLFSETNKQSISDGITIKREFERNDVIRYIFGDLTSKTPWGQNHLYLNNGVRIMTFSMQSSPRGLNIENQRPDMIVLDDFEGESNSDTADKREQVMEFLLKVLKPLGVGSRTRFIFLGTIVHEEAFLARNNPNKLDDTGKLTEDSRNSWFRPEYDGAYTEFSISDYPYDGTNDLEITPSWKEEYDLEYIKSEWRAYKSQGKLAAFYQEYYNIPATSSNPTIDVSKLIPLDAEFKLCERMGYLKHGDGRKEICRVYIGADPAIKTGLNNDDTVFFALGLLSDETYVILEILAEKIKIEDQPSRLFEFMLKYYPYATVIECIQYQLSLYEQVKKLCRDHNKHFLMYPIDKKMNKTNSYIEIDGLCHVINNGRMKYLMTTDISKFKTQAKAYSSGNKREHDDTLDGCYLALQNNYFPPKTDIDEWIRKVISGSKKKRVKNFMSL